MTNDVALALAISGIPNSVLQSKLLLTAFNLDEFHTIILSAQSLAKELPRLPGTTATSDTSVQVLERRLAQVDKWVSEGHNLIIVLDDVKPVPVIRGSQSLAPFDPRKIQLLNGLNWVEAHGDSVEYVGPESALLDNVSEQLRYFYIIELKNGRALYRVRRSTAGADQIVAAVREHGKGRVFIMPQQVRGDIEMYPLLLSDLPALVPQHSASALPQWVTEFNNPIEADAQRTIFENESQIEICKKEIANALRALSDVAWLKELFAGSGDGFVSAVSQALAALGLMNGEGPHPRGDLLIYDGTKIAVAEVKGLDGVAREANLRQALRWTADVNSTLATPPDERAADQHLVMYAEKLKAIGVDPDSHAGGESKGLMIIGTHRKTPLDQRADKDFPDEVLRIAERDKVCCMTGLDLLVWHFTCQENPELCATFREKLFTTNGHLKPPRDWKTILNKV